MGKEASVLIPLYLILGFSVAYLLDSILSITMAPRFGSKKSRMGFVIAYVFYNGLFAGMITPKYRFFSTLLFCALFAAVFYKGAVYRLIIVLTVWNVLTAAAEVITVFLMTALNLEVSAADLASLVIMNVGTGSVLLILGILVRRFIKIAEYPLTCGQWIRIVSASVMMFLTSAALLFDMTCRVMVNDGSWIFRYSNLITAAAFFSPIIALIIILGSNNRLSESIREQEEYRIGEQMAQQELESTREMLDKYENLRAIRHDMQGHLSAISVLAENGETDGLKAYIDRLQEGLRSTREQVFCGNTIIDNIFAQKARNALNKQISFVVDAEPCPKELPLTGIELSVIFNNLLDNAIDAAGEAVRRNIHVILRINESAFTLRITNTCADAHSALEKLKGRRVHHDLHGFGYSNVQYVVRERFGSLKAESVDDTIVITAYVPFG